MVTPASLNGAYWALAVPAASVDATKSPVIMLLMNASQMWSSPLPAGRQAFWHACGSLSVPSMRWPSQAEQHRRPEWRRTDAMRDQADCPCAETPGLYKRLRRVAGRAELPPKALAALNVISDSKRVTDNRY